MQFIDIKIPDNTAEEMQNYISYIAWNFSVCKYTHTDKLCCLKVRV